MVRTAFGSTTDKQEMGWFHRIRREISSDTKVSAGIPFRCRIYGNKRSDASTIKAMEVDISCICML